MTLLDAERQHAHEAPAQTPPEVPEQQPAAASAPACANCAAPLVPEQEWCLNCGAAVAGPVAGRAGWRTFSTIAALTLVLVLGAVAASYAALSSHKRKPAVVAAPPAQVAQTPPAAVPAPPATSTPAATPKAVTPKALPKVKAPSTAPAAGGTPVKPAPTSTPKTTVPTPPSSSSSTPVTKAPAKSTTPKPTAPVALKLDPGAGSTYDPYGKAAATGDPAKALDGDPSTSWYIDPTAASGPIAAGYAINLGAKKAVKRIELATTTPGFRVEVYATDEATPPPDISDTRWSHITNVSKVGASSGKQTIVVGGGTSKYQTVLLWITDRPSDGARVRISELKLFG